MEKIIIDSAEKIHQIRLTESGQYRIEITAEGAEVEIKGGWRTSANESVEIILEIVHRARHTSSRTLLRGAAGGQSRLTLSGTIIIEPGAQNTNAFLTENILLLSDQASAQAVPNLEISANEVKCSHAATVSKIPEEHLFYLRARGIDRLSAQDLIVSGFLAGTQFPQANQES
jgi:Fe-S cluster assembly protein SufD